MAKEEFEAKKVIFETMPDSVVKYPGMPVDVALQESENLFVWCVDDKELLVKGGLNWDLVVDLPKRTGSCRYMESEWQKEYRSIENAQLEWKEKAPVAFELRDELLHHFNHAFYGRPDLLAQVKKIAEGSSNADMIQDLSDLSVLGKANKPLFTNTLMELSQLDEAATIADKLSEVLAQSNSEKLKDNKKRILRDKTFVHMKEAVDEIRRVGQYVFWKNDARRKGYISKYNKLKRKNKTKDDTDNEESK